MRVYFIQDDCGLAKVESRKGKEVKRLSFKNTQYVDKTRVDIVDHGNGWTLNDGSEVHLNYSQVADIVAAFLMWQSEGDNLWEGKIYGRNGAITVKSNRKGK